MRIMALDIGGTAMKAAVYEDGRLERLREYRTNAYQGGAHVLGRASDIIRQYAAEGSFERIAVSTAGQVDPENGSILYANDNIPGYTGMRVRELLEEQFHLPVTVENDVNAAAVGEACFGAGRGERQFVCLTYGTGVGGAVFADGRLYRGAHFAAGELGGIVVHSEDRNPEADGYSGCYEQYASVSALIRRVREYDAAVENGRQIFERIEDAEIGRLVDEWITEILYGLTSIIHILNPSCIILGGGVMEQDYVVNRIKADMQKHLLPGFQEVRIHKAELGNRAGLYGVSLVSMRG